MSTKSTQEVIEFEYWDIHVQEAIEFHKNQLSIQ